MGFRKFISFMSFPQDNLVHFFESFWWLWTLGNSSLLKKKAEMISKMITVALVQVSIFSKHLPQSTGYVGF